MQPDKFSGDKNQDLEGWIIQVRRFRRLATTPDELLVDTAPALLSDLFLSDFTSLWLYHQKFIPSAPNHSALRVWNAAERFH
jgi:hypothetical protein